VIVYFTGAPLATPDYLELMKGRRVMYSFVARNRSAWADLSHFAGVALDSGAYSVWRRGAKVDLGEYADYCARLEGSLDWYANLDAIADWRMTLANQAALERRGLRPVPVFHLGEPWALLDDLAICYERVAIGRGPGMKLDEVWSALDTVFTRYTNEDGAPTVRFHGFRMTDRRVMATFPFDSVDSTTWIAGNAYGMLPTDTGRAGGFAFLSDKTKARVWLEFFDAAPKAYKYVHHPHHVPCSRRPQRQELGRISNSTRRGLRHDLASALERR
jgi:hypothetical protein